jgi:hypothetical protein
MTHGKVVPFGKYKGQPAETLLADKDYTDWLVAQPWFAERFRDIYAVVINYGFEPAETPEHNTMQVKFLNSTYCSGLLECLVKNSNRRASANKRTIRQEFEVNGWDVVLDAHLFEERCIEIVDAHYQEISFSKTYSKFIPGPLGWWGNEICYYEPYTSKVEIECKPTLGADFPAVLRQIKARPREGFAVLVIDRFAEGGATLEEVREVFDASGIQIVMASEIEARALPGVFGLP